MTRSPSIYYKEPVFRPPSEARSLLIQATEGCTFRCSFCVSNLGKKFLMRSFDDIKKDLDAALEIYGPMVRRIFLLDGNAFVMPTKRLKEIAEYANKCFPYLERIGAYAHAKDILRKTDEELETLADVGLKIVYVGIETGNDELLKTIGKQTTSEELAKAAQKIHNASITFSGTIILGLAGNDPEKSRIHAIDTAKLINKMNPPKEHNKAWYISALTLMVPPGTPIFNQVKKGEFTPLNSREVLIELKNFLSELDDDLHDCIFRSNHASNYLPLKGVLAKDKQKLISIVQKGLDHPEILRPDYYRAL